MDAIFDYISKELFVFLVSMVPVVELRGAIPIAMGYGIPTFKAYAIAIAGNLVPIPFIIAYMKPIFGWIKRHTFLKNIISKIEKRTEKKADKINKYSLLALWLFVAIPLPGTGAWTGAMIAAFMDMRVKKAFPAIALGVVTAGIIVAVVSKLGITLYNMF